MSDTSRPETIVKGAKPAACRLSCPAGVDAPRYLRLIAEGRFCEALAVVREKVPFPATLGRVCLAPCEAACQRAKLCSPIAIRALKRCAADYDTEKLPTSNRVTPPTGKKVAIVGSGPAGLTAGFFLAGLGHSITVLEALPQPGGMMRVGIPGYRLPRATLEREIEEIRAAGVDIRTNNRVDSLDELFKLGYDVVLVAVGTHRGQKLPIPGADLKGVLIATSFLRDVNLGNKVEVGRRVVVLGGGNVAFDCARVALRLGARSVDIACLEPRSGMLAVSEEIEQGEEEGIVVHNSHTFTRILGERGRATGVECLDVEAFDFDGEGRARINPVRGSEHVLPADTVIFAIGQTPEIPERWGLATGRSNTVRVDRDTLATSREKVFACGDAVSGPTSVIEAIAAGRHAAASIDRFLGGSGAIDRAPVVPEQSPAGKGYREEILYERRQVMPLFGKAERLKGFAEVELGFSNAQAVAEAGRCFGCDERLLVSVTPGKCTECYVCQLVCSLTYQGACNPEKARVAVGSGKISWTEDCVGGCSLCIQHCPRKAIALEDE